MEPEAQAFLTWIVVLAALSLALMGAFAFAEHRYAMLRTLSTKVLDSALTYALLFRVAAWALDPERDAARSSGAVRSCSARTAASSW